MIPKGWQTKKISEILERVVDPIIPESEKLYQEIGIRSHSKGIFHKEHVTGKALGNKRVFRIYPDCFVVNIVFAWEQAIAKTTSSEKGMIASHRFPMYKPKENCCDIDYILYLFNSLKGKYLLGLASPGGAGRNKTLGQNEFARLAITIPPQKEQQKIAQILATWDKAIATTEALIDNAKQQKKALMQQLLTGKRRFTGFGGEWFKHLFSDFSKLEKGKFEPKKAKDMQECIELEHIEQHTSRLLGSTNTITSKSTKNVFRKNDVLFGKLRPYLRKYWLADRNGVCSTEIWVFKANDRLILPDYLFLLIQTDYFIDNSNVASGTHMPRADWSVVKDIRFILPGLEEQKKIATILFAASKEVDALQTQLTHLQQEKKALMQQLLTGKRRVKVDDPMPVAATA